MILIFEIGPAAVRIISLAKSLRDCIPHEFNRKPRGLEDSDRWKATECRTFLCYVGIVVLKCIKIPEVI